MNKALYDDFVYVTFNRVIKRYTEEGDPDVSGEKGAWRLENYITSVQLS